MSDLGMILPVFWYGGKQSKIRTYGAIRRSYGKGSFCFSTREKMEV